MNCFNRLVEFEEARRSTRLLHSEDTLKGKTPYRVVKISWRSRGTLLSRTPMGILRSAVSRASLSLNIDLHLVQRLLARVLQEGGNLSTLPSILNYHLVIEEKQGAQFVHKTKHVDAT